MIGTKYKRILVISIILIVVLSGVAASAGKFIKKNAKASGELSQDDQKTVDNIANMTGAGVDEIISLKNSGKTWNDILDLLKSKAGSTRQQTEEMSKLLAGAGLGQDFLEQLKAEGYEENEITTAKMLIERITYQLKEIAQSQDDLETVNISDTNSEEKKDAEISAYRELSEKIDMKTAVYLMLRLKQDFGGIEKVLDEYLYCLQIGVDMQIYFTDKKAYEKERQEKSACFDLQEIITIEKIEAKILELLQQKNEKKNNNTSVTPENKTTTDNFKEDPDKKEDLPTSPVPEINSPKPKNPGEDVMKELNEVRNKVLNVN